MSTCTWAEEVFGLQDMIACKCPRRRVAKGQMRHIRDCQGPESCGHYTLKTGRMRNTPMTRGDRRVKA